MQIPNSAYYQETQYLKRMFAVGSEMFIVWNMKLCGRLSPFSLMSN
jgi:hypothetical protein